MKFVLATHNPGKLKEMADIPSDPNFERFGSSEYTIAMVDARPAGCPPSRTTPVSVWTP